MNHLNDVFEHFEIKCLEAVISQEQVLKVTTSTQTERILSKDAGGSNHAELAPIPIVEPEPGLHVPKGLRQHMVRQQLQSQLTAVAILAVLNCDA